MKSRLIIYSIALAAVSIAQAAYNPIPITTGSYNADAIVESNATPVLKCVTTASLDSGTNNTASTWYEIGYDPANPTFGLPAANSVVTARDNANYSFRMPPTYVGPNGILIDTIFTNATFTLTAPAAYNLLSFAGSGGNGGDVIGVRVNHADGTFETGSFGCPDWFGASGVIMAAQGRMGDNVAHTLQVNGDNPRIYFRDVSLTNTTSPVTNIILSYISGSSGSHNDVLAVSGATTLGGPVAPIAVTGYTHDFVVEASADKRGRVVSQTIVDGTNVWATTQTYDNDANTGFTYYEKGYNFNLINNLPFIYGVPAIDAIAQASGIPNHGATFTNTAGDHIYTMAPSYTTNDVVWLSPVVTNATINLVTPTAASALSFLCAAGNGPVQPTAVVHHQNGFSETNTLIIVDWFSGSTPIYIPNGRVDTGSGQFSQVTVAGTGADRLFATDLPLADVVSPVTSIDLVYTNTGGRAAIFAVSALAGAVPPIFTQNPATTNTMAGNDVFFSAQVSGTTPFTFQWQKGTNGTFATLSNGGNVSGATTTNLAITSANYFSDAADYRIVASNAGGSVTSSVASAILFSTNTDVTQPGDPISPFNANLFGDGAVANGIDNNLGTKYGAGLIVVGNPIGFVVSPAVGPTLVTALRFFTANDAPERDPSDYKLEGSINGGSTYTLIASNSMTLPQGRNNTGSPDPLVAFAQEVHFANTAGYTTYRVTFSHLAGGPTQGSFQIGDVELLGVTTNLPVFVTVPQTAKAYAGNPLTINATVNGTPTPASRWQKQISGVFTDLADGGTVTGSHTASLTINPAVLSDSGQFRIIASNSVTIVTSAVVQVTIFSTNVDVTVPFDPITDFGNTSVFASTPNGALEGSSSTSFTTQGSGLNRNGGGAGFPPFAGPVGLVITPSAGTTLITGVRFYTGGDPSSDDPADFKLEGSNNGGTSYSTIVPTTALSLPDDRNTGSVDPLNSAVQEILFANSQSYTSYRLTFNHTKDDNSANILSIGELELLGVVTAPQPTISGTTFSGGNLNFSITGGTPNGTYSVLTNADVMVPVASWGTATTGTLDGSGNASVSLPVSPSNPRLFYRIRTP
jgi:hypothetical protein